MYLKSLELAGFKSFARKSTLEFSSPITAIVGPNGSGKSNIAEAFRFVLGEQSFKSMRGRRGEDLIFGGTPEAARANRASVKVVFDNSARLLDIEYDEVEVERVVHRDGVNQYSINGSQVRLKDVVELLASAHIGPSGYHIISQGEADRVLSAPPLTRREMVEDALGLKVYQYKKKESEKKLEKTEENIERVESLRHEVGPHLRFLERQVKKIEKTLAMKDELRDRYREYLKREEVYLEVCEQGVATARKEPQEEIQRLDAELVTAEERLALSEQHDEKSDQVIALEKQLSDIRAEKDTQYRDVGRIEGRLAFEEQRLAQEKKEREDNDKQSVRLSELRRFKDDIEQTAREALGGDDTTSLRAALEKVREVARAFFARHFDAHPIERETPDAAQLEELREQKARCDRTIEELNAREGEVEGKYRALQKEIEASRDTSREAEREIFRITTRQNELRATLAELNHRQSALARDRAAFEQEIREGIVLVGQEIGRYKEYAPARDGVALSREDIAKEPREEQEKRKRDIERIKIRIEEVGGGASEEIMREYEEVKERDAFLERELADLRQSAAQLRQLIKDLEERLDVQFREGLEKINREFQGFFSLLFGGGTAKLAIERREVRRAPQEIEQAGEEEAAEEERRAEGIEINVTLPRKRIKGLDMLSGGERALTSIALLFAMSQVNPPPFIVLDETDAALDEANSRKYGDMTERLSKHSQLILITHNRETMRRAGILYGITMGADGVSKLLSVKFDEAVAVAK